MGRDGAAVVERNQFMTHVPPGKAEPAFPLPQNAVMRAEVAPDFFRVVNGKVRGGFHGGASFIIKILLFIGRLHRPRAEAFAVAARNGPGPHSAQVPKNIRFRTDTK